MRTTTAHRVGWRSGRAGGERSQCEDAVSIIGDKIAFAGLYFDPRTTVLSGDFRKNVAFRGK